jgi:hypothetical protein
MPRDRSAAALSLVTTARMAARHQRVLPREGIDTATPDGARCAAPCELTLPRRGNRKGVVEKANHTAGAAVVANRCDRYSVPTELAAFSVVVLHPVGGEYIDIVTAGGIVVPRHRRAADGLGVTMRDSGHVIALISVSPTQPKCPLREAEPRSGPMHSP